jgi:hypothetical protein
LSACPSARVLERLLAEELTGSERDTVETHVEVCVSCQGQLETLVAPTLPQGVPADMNPSKSEPEPGRGFLSRLRELSPPRAGSSLGVHWPPPPAAASRPAVPDASGGGALWPENGRLGQYEILGKLGRGGMGAVFKARHTELGKVVALKVLPVERRDEVGIARFKNEVRAIGKLDHPNIVVAHDAGESRGVHFLVMELVDGMDLARVVARHGRLPIPEACEAVRQAAVGLQHAYERGVVHRDVKPSNVMLARDGRVRLLDLGLARSFGEAAADRLTVQGTLLGTIDYLAPEQWDQPHAADTRADIYSLGCTLYHLLAGRPPFADGPYQSLPGKMRAHREVPPPPVGQFCPEAPAGLVAALGRMLAKNAADRFATPAEVAAALRPFTAGADPGRLIAENAAAVPAGVAPANAATPAPGARETDPERCGWRPPVPARHRALPVAALAGLYLVLAAGAIAWPLGSPEPTGKPLGVTEMRVLHYRDKGKTLVGDLRNSSLAVRLNDNVRVRANLTAPAHYYLIAFNPRCSEAGLEQLCQPEGESGNGAEGTRPDLCTEVQYPRDTHDFFLDATGLQVFVLAASTKPLPPYKEWRSRTGAIPWEGVKDGGGAWRWHFDGRTFTRFPRERGRVEAREDAPEPLRKLRAFFAKRPEFEVIQIVAFPVEGDGE